MTLLLWVLVSVVVSAIGIPLAILGSAWYAHRLFEEGNWLADERLTKFVEEVRKGMEDQGKEREFSREEFLEKNGPMLTAVADHMFARFKHLEGSSKGGSTAPGMGQDSIFGQLARITQAEPAEKGAVALDIMKENWQ